MRETVVSVDGDPLKAEIQDGRVSIGAVMPGELRVKTTDTQPLARHNRSPSSD